MLAGLRGGRKNKKAKQRDKARKAAIAAAMSARRRAELTQELLPLYRSLVAAGPGAAKQQGVASNLGRFGYTGTGVGEAMRDASRALPDFEALRLATQDAGDLQRNQIIGLSGQAFDPYVEPQFSQWSPGELAQMGAVFAALGNKGPYPNPAGHQLMPEDLISDWGKRFRSSPYANINTASLFPGG